MRFLAVVAVLCGVLLSSMPTADAQVEGLSYKEDTIFTVTDGGVEVITDAVMTNTSRERRSGNTIYYSYFDTYVVIVPIGAEDLRITSRGATLSSTGEALDDDFELRTVTLPSQLRSGQSRSFTVTYTLPAGEIRGEGLFFSNPAFHAFPMWSFSDPGTGSLLLRVPEDADMNEFGGVLQQTGFKNGYIEWTPLDFELPEDVFAYITVTVDEQLQASTFSVAGQLIEIRTWPGDDVWESFAAQTITDGLPQLEALIGLPVPEQDTLEITESVTPYFYGYGGWYNPADTSIEVGNELDQNVMIHELSHAWFNRDLFVERWASEGLAEEYTWRTMAELGWEPESLPANPDLSSFAAGPLLAWGENGIGGVDDADFRAREEYGYATSWYVIHELYELIGQDGMQQLLAAADGNTTAYPGGDLREVTNKQNDWRRLLDLASLHTSPEIEAEIEALFIDYVVEEPSLELIERRAEVRQQYLAFANDNLNWRVPDDLRSSMELWQFSSAEAVMDEAAEVRSRYDSVQTAAEIADLELSTAARELYELANPDFAASLEVLEKQDVAIGDVQAVRDTAQRDRTAEERWGLRHITLGSFVDRAETAFAKDDTGQIALTQAEIDSLLEEASRVGEVRILWTKIGGTAFVAFVGLGGVFLVRSRRRSSGVALTPILVGE